MKKRDTFIFYLIIGVLGLPFFINMIMVLFENLPVTYNFIFANNLENKEWLSFWGSYLSGVATFISVYVMFRMNEKILSNQNKEIKYKHDQDNFNELKRLLIQSLEGFEISHFLTFNMSNLEEHRKNFQIYQERLIKNKISLELLTDIYIPINSIKDEDLKIKIKNLRYTYDLINTTCVSLISEYLIAMNGGAESLKSIIGNTKTEKYLLTMQHSELRMKAKEYLLYKEQIINKNFND